MNELKKRIDNIEVQATESELIGRLASDPEVRTRNKRLAVELRDYAKQLRSGILIRAENNRSADALEPGSVHPEAQNRARDEEKCESGA